MVSVSVEPVQTRRKAGAFVFLAMMVVFGSTTATAAKFTVLELPAGFIPVARYGLAVLCLLAMTGWSGVRQVWCEDRRRLLLASALCVPINQTFFLNGTKLAPTSHVAFLYATTPLVVLALAAAVGQERITRERLAGVLVTVLGAAVLAVGDVLTHHRASSAAALRGDLLLVGAVLAWGGYLTVTKPLVMRYGSIPSLTATFLVGWVLALPLAGWSLVGHAHELRTASAAAWWGMLCLGVVGSVIALGCQNQALKRLDASQVATVNNASPLLTVLWGVWLLNETLTPAILVGGAMILGGVIWTIRAEARAASTSRAEASAEFE